MTAETHTTEDRDVGLRDVITEALDHAHTGIELLERLITQLTHTSDSGTPHARHQPGQPLAEHARVLLTNHTSPAATAAAAAALERTYPLEREHTAIIAHGPEAHTTLRTLATTLDRRLLTIDHDEQTTWAWLAGTRKLHITQLQHALTTHPPAHDLALAVGEPAHGLPGWRLTHHQAHAALPIAEQHPRQLTRYADVALLAAALKDATLAQTLTNTYLAPLEDHRGNGPLLTQTLRAYIATSQNITSTAATLKVARSTIENRLQTTETRLNKTLHPHPPELTTALQLNQHNNTTHTPQTPTTHPATCAQTPPQNNHIDVASNPHKR